MAYSIISGFMNCGKNGVSAVNPNCKLAAHALQEQKWGSFQSLLEFWMLGWSLTLDYGPSNP